MKVPRPLTISMHLTKKLRSGSLAERSIQGSLWTTAGFSVNYSLRLISTLFLTRLLTPDAFGIMSLATVFLGAIALLSDIGTTPSVIRSYRATEKDFLQTAWTVQVMRGGGIAIMVSLLAWPIAILYGEPLLLPIMIALSVTAILDGFSSISIPIARRRMQLERLTILDVLTQIIVTLLTIVVAWLIGSVWALVIGALMGSAIRLLLSYMILEPFKHGFRLERTALTEIITYGRWILLGTVLNFFGGRGLQAVYGTLVSLEILGMITIAGVIAWALGDLITRILDNTIFPAISQLARERPESIATNLRKIKLILVSLSLPLFFAVSYFSHGIVDLLYDERYLMAGSFLSILALNGAVGVLSMPYQSALLAIGNSRDHAAVMASSAILKIFGAVAGYHFGGVLLMLAANGFAGAIVLMVSAFLVHRKRMAALSIDLVSLVAMLAAYLFVLSYL